jgi:predicted DNA-binding transcriptional regulator YafY
MDLVTTLLSHRFGATLEQLRSAVPGYATGSPESTRRTFERDKDELRALGVPIETSAPDDDGEIRYSIAFDRFYLPYLSLVTARGVRRAPRVDRYGYRALGEMPFTDEDFTLLADAAERVTRFGDPVLAEDAAMALHKLAIDIPAEHLEPTPGVTVLPARPPADADHLARLGDALLRRKQVSFTYYGIERDEIEQRVVLPYGLAYTSGHWYLHALDPARGAIRLFRVSRMRDVKVNPRTPGTQDYEIPPSFRLAERAEPMPPWALGEDTPCSVEVEFVHANGATRAARKLGTASRTQPDRVRYDVRRRDAFLRWLLALAGDARPIAPPDVVRAWHDLVTQTIASHERTP